MIDQTSKVDIVSSSDDLQNSDLSGEYRQFIWKRLLLLTLLVVGVVFSLVATL